MKDAFYTLQIKMALNAKAREKLYRKLAQLMRNGVSLDRALTQIYMLETKNEKRMTPVGRLYRRWRYSLDNGVNFGQCIGPFVPASEAMLIETGSDSGHLERSLHNAADAVQQQKRVKNTIISSASYPIVLVLMLMAALALAAYKIIPNFAEVLPVNQWQGVSYQVAMVSEFIRAYGMVIIISIVSFFTVVFWSMPRWTGPSRMYVEKIVPWSIYRMWQGASFLLSVASLMTAGVKLDSNSLSKLADHASPYLRERINAIAREAASGNNLGECLHNVGYNFPDEEIISDIRIYATLKGFEDNLITVTRDWVGEVEDNVRIAMKVVNFVTLFLIALTIGILISSLFGVIQQVQSSASM